MQKKKPCAVMEYTLTSEPDFDDQISLTEIIMNGIEKFISAVIGRLCIESSCRVVGKRTKELHHKSAAERLPILFND